MRKGFIESIFIFFFEILIYFWHYFHLSICAVMLPFLFLLSQKIF